MTIVTSRSPITAEELFELPDDGGRCELVNGEIIRLEPGGAEHGVVTARIGHLIQEFVTANASGFAAVPRPGSSSSGTPTSFAPRDAAFVASSRIPETGVPVGYWPFAPDLAVEVVSPNDRVANVHAKITDYLAAGTRLVWLVEPETRDGYTSTVRPGRLMCWEWMTSSTAATYCPASDLPLEISFPGSPIAMSFEFGLSLFFSCGL